MANLASSISTMNNKWWTYDVFLSFRGEDTRRSFTDHLYHALTDAGLYTFRDDIDLPRGETIRSELQSVICESKICVVVFSKNYATSKWCLEELAEIIKCRRTLPQVLLPVFYDVDPAAVRKQSNSFAEAFTKHEQEFVSSRCKLDIWRAALNEAGNISGWDLTNFVGGEGEFIRKIVDQIVKELKPLHQNVAVYPVGIETRIRRLCSILSKGKKVDTFILGICGMGGSGKTTLGKALFNHYLNSFEGSSFIANVRENSNILNGMIHLQTQLLCDILKTKQMVEISNVDMGMNIIKERLCRKRVFLVLDDVDSVNQVRAIIGKRDWFGFGSIVIITTRNMQLLDALKVDQIFMTEEFLLDEKESLELFSWHAFEYPCPPDEFFEHSKDVVSHCKSLPLALEVLGSFLSGRNILEWRSAIEKLKSIPHRDIYKQLKISYDALNDHFEKNIFLDVCCFFVGMEKDLVVKILDGFGFYGEIGLSVLISRCLVKIDELGFLMMHDLLLDMGRQIVKEDALKEPGKRKRLWHKEEIYNVLRSNTGTENIEGLTLELPATNKEEFHAEAFGKMTNLRLLKLNYVHLRGNFNYLKSKNLRWLCWCGFPLKVIPINFYIEKLVVIDMRYSKLEELWKGTQCLENLRILNLNGSQLLIRLPNFSKVSNLEELKLKNCVRLSEVHPSIGQLHKLRLITLKGCCSLDDLPSNIYKLKSLQVLDIRYCTGIDKLHEALGELKSLTTLNASFTHIIQIPNSIAWLENLEDLRFQGCFNFGGNSQPSLQGLVLLTSLNLGFCYLTDDDIIRMDIGSLSSLKELHLYHNYFEHFLVDISDLSKLVYLDLSDCTRLQSMPELPENLEYFRARSCVSLKKTSDLTTLAKSLQELALNGCKELVEAPGLMSRLGGSVSLLDCSGLSNVFKMNLVKKWIETEDGGTILLPGDEVPECLNIISSGSSLSFQIPHKVDRNIQQFQLCVAYFNFFPFEVGSIKVNNKSKDSSVGFDDQYPCRVGMPAIAFNIIKLKKIHALSALQLGVGDNVELLIESNRSRVKKVGICIVYDNDEKNNRSLIV